MKEKGPCGDCWGSREGEGGVLMAVDSALSVRRWRGTGCPQQASLWRAVEVSVRALEREQAVPCVVTSRQADALQRNYLWEQEEGVPGTLGLLSVSLGNQSALCLWRPPVADLWALPCTSVHRADSAGRSWWEGWRGCKHRGICDHTCLGLSMAAEELHEWDRLLRRTCWWPPTLLQRGTSSLSFKGDMWLLICLAVEASNSSE